MDTCKPILNTGLRGFTVATTKVSGLDAEASKLIYRGYVIKDLAEKVTFEEVVYLLLYEHLPTPAALKDFSEQLKAERDLPASLVDALIRFPKTAFPMDILQSGISMLAHHDPDVGDRSIEATNRMAMRLIAKLTTLCAAWHRIRNGEDPIPPRKDLGHAANFLYMLTGEPAPEDTSHFFDTSLVLHAEHSFNASTFTARQVASTRAHIYAAVAAAVGSLSGELHGGANARVMQMLIEIGAVEKIDAYIQDRLEQGGVIMGLGHAVYKTDDPRAHILAPMSRTLAERSGDMRWYELSKALEERGKKAFREKKGKDIYVNVDFYSASFYYYLGIPIDLFTPVFAMARVVGWSAHVIEEQFAGASPKPVLYRPDSEYIGDYCGPGECAFVPLGER